jgi:hypothetical protein
MLEAGAELLGNEMTGTRAAVFSAVQSDAQSAIGVFHHLAGRPAGRIDDIDYRRLPGLEERSVEQQPGQESS